MSFYGNVAYYFSNAFSEIVYDNVYDGHNAKNSAAIPNVIGDQYTFSPTSRDDQTHLIAYNKWILFGGDRALSNTNKAYIFHNTNLTQSIELAPNTGGSITDTTLKPQFGEIITVPHISFDEAGHLTSGTMTSIQIPTNPGLTDINALKTRIAQVEENLAGSHGDAGNGTVSPVGNNSIAHQLSDLRRITSTWQQVIAASPTPYDSLKEDVGIGDALHELMVLIGIRRNTDATGQLLQYVENGITYQGYQKQTTTDAANNTQTIYGMANTAFAITSSVARSTESQRQGCVQLMNALVSAGSLGEAEKENLERTFFPDPNA